MRHARQPTAPRIASNLDPDRLWAATHLKCTTRQNAACAGGRRWPEDTLRRTPPATGSGTASQRQLHRLSGPESACVHDGLHLRNPPMRLMPRMPRCHRPVSPAGCREPGEEANTTDFRRDHRACEERLRGSDTRTAKCERQRRTSPRITNRPQGAIWSERNGWTSQSEREHYKTMHRGNEQTE